MVISVRKLVPLPPSPLRDKLYAAIDGTGVPVTAKEAAGGTTRARTGAPAPARSSCSMRPGAGPSPERARPPHTKPPPRHSSLPNSGNGCIT